LRAGFQVGDAIVDVADAAAGVGLEDAANWSSSRAFLAAPHAAREKVAAAASALPATLRNGSLEGVRLGPPVPDPEKIVCVGLNYRDHAHESGLDIPEALTLFAKYPNALAGPNDRIRLRPANGSIDYEAELAVVIGKECSEVSASDALDYVAGAMALNDVSDRALQLRTSQWTAGKIGDGFAPCGPALVSLDEVGDVQSLEITTTVNGETVQAGSTAEMIFPVRECVSHISSLMTLRPGDIISTGTPAGVGMARTPPLLLDEGDEVRVAISGLGELRNRIGRLAS
jgi:2-keto-4-pentenoate hydratase/2-oxohepta-3-ene-1,7-dioic acid hydratase in catechol pathway